MTESQFLPLHTDGRWIKDSFGRVRILRGVNMSGSTKVPTVPDGATHRSEHFYNHREVSFVGRPFPLEDADEHFARLRRWGLTSLRFLVTWEAIEHAGPGLYDEEYIAYVHQILQRAASHGISVFIDPHQDVWSRFTGGDGAPGWTLEAVGFDVTALERTGAAVTHQMMQEPLRDMTWPTNYGKLGAATMFTLFFGGDLVARVGDVEGESYQSFLQGHYIRAIQHLAKKLVDLPNVIGFDSLNEPHCGYLGLKNLTRKSPGIVRKGLAPTFLQACASGEGIPQRVRRYTLGALGERVVGKEWINEEGVRAWRDDAECIWRRNGVWDVVDGKPKVTRPDHFVQEDGQRLDFARHCLTPFLRKYTEEMRKLQPKALIFVEGIPTPNGHPQWKEDRPEGIVYAGHWYDFLSLFFKRHMRKINVDIVRFPALPIVGEAAVRRMFAKQISHICKEVRHDMGDVPVLIGEFGFPMDANDKVGPRTGDYSSHAEALGSHFDAMDANLVSCTLWNYTPDNNHAHGDNWNAEDLSIYCADGLSAEQLAADPDAAGRALDGVVRPYATAVAGEPTQMHYDMHARRFVLRYHADPSLDAATEIRLPHRTYPEGVKVHCSVEADITVDGDLLSVRLRANHGERILVNLTVMPKTI